MEEEEERCLLFPSLSRSVFNLPAYSTRQIALLCSALSHPQTPPLSTSKEREGGGGVP